VARVLRVVLHTKTSRAAAWLLLLLLLLHAHLTLHAPEAKLTLGHHLHNLALALH
jgi:hypothetical protein